jgi:hypothetical protein
VGATEDLFSLLEEIGATPTLDHARSTALPCIFCGRSDQPRQLVDVGVWTVNAYGGMRAGDAITRPLCPDCAARAAPKDPMTEKTEPKTTAGRYRKKPVEIEAIHIGELLESHRVNGRRALPLWVARAIEEKKLLLQPARARVRVSTPEGEMVGDHPDYLIRGIANEIYPCKPDIFHASYDAVGPTRPSFDPRFNQTITGLGAPITIETRALDESKNDHGFFLDGTIVIGEHVPEPLKHTVFMHEALHLVDQQLVGLGVTKRQLPHAWITEGAPLLTMLLIAAGFWKDGPPLKELISVGRRESAKAHAGERL